MQILKKLFNKLTGLHYIKEINAKDIEILNLKCDVYNYKKLSDELNTSLSDKIAANLAFINKYEQLLRDYEKLHIEHVATVNSKSSAEKEVKDLKRKHSRLLLKRKEQKAKISQLETDKKIMQAKVKHLSSLQDKVNEELSLLRKELESMGIYEPNDITELQAKIKVLEKKISYMSTFQNLQDDLIDRYKYGFSFAYIESLKPRTVVELTKKDLQNGNSN